MPIISVIVPVYNVEAWLGACVDSILCQTFRDLELILVDDGSPDGCGAICDEYARLDSRVRVIHKTNGGLSSARNAGLDISRGEYVAFIDSDDYVNPCYLESMLRSIQEHEADLALCSVEKFWDDPSRVEYYHQPDKCLGHEQAVALMVDSLWYHMIACNKLYRRSLFDDLRFPEGYIHEDEALFHHIIARCARIVSVSGALYRYRQISGSIMHQGCNIQKSDKLTALSDRIAFAHRHHWQDVITATVPKFYHIFWLYYSPLSRTAENEKYFRRMEASLKKVLPHILREKTIPLHHKLYMVMIRVHPGLYGAFRTIISKFSA